VEAVRKEKTVSGAKEVALTETKVGKSIRQKAVNWPVTLISVKTRARLVFFFLEVHGQF